MNVIKKDENLYNEKDFTDLFNKQEQDYKWKPFPDHYVSKKAQVDQNIPQISTKYPYAHVITKLTDNFEMFQEFGADDTISPLRVICWNDISSLTPKMAAKTVEAALDRQYASINEDITFECHSVTSTKAQRGEFPNGHPDILVFHVLDPTIPQTHKYRSSHATMMSSFSTSQLSSIANGKALPQNLESPIQSNRESLKSLSKKYAGQKSIFIFDCSFAKKSLEGLLYNEKAKKNPFIIFAATSHLLNYSSHLPCDLFTSCLLTPAKVALLWQSQKVGHFQSGILKEIDLQTLIDQLNDSEEAPNILTVLNSALNAIADKIAIDYLLNSDNTNLFFQLFRSDAFTSQLLYNYMFSTRVMNALAMDPCSFPPMIDSTQHPLWDTFDLQVDRTLFSLVNSFAPIHIPHSIFSMNDLLNEAMEKLQSWLRFPIVGRKMPNEICYLPMLLLSQSHFKQAIVFCSNFIQISEKTAKIFLFTRSFPVLPTCLNRIEKNIEMYDAETIAAFSFVVADSVLLVPKLAKYFKSRISFWFQFVPDIDFDNSSFLNPAPTTATNANNNININNNNNSNNNNSNNNNNNNNNDNDNNNNNNTKNDKKKNNNTNANNIKNKKKSSKSNDNNNNANSNAKKDNDDDNLEGNVIEDLNVNSSEDNLDDDDDDNFINDDFGISSLSKDDDSSEKEDNIPVRRYSNIITNLSSSITTYNEITDIDNDDNAGSLIELSSPTQQNTQDEHALQLVVISSLSVLLIFLEGEDQIELYKRSNIIELLQKIQRSNTLPRIRCLANLILSQLEVPIGPDESCLISNEPNPLCRAALLSRYQVTLSQINDTISDPKRPFTPSDEINRDLYLSEVINAMNDLYPLVRENALVVLSHAFNFPYVTDIKNTRDDKNLINPNALDIYKRFFDCIRNSIANNDFSDESIPCLFVKNLRSLFYETSTRVKETVIQFCIFLTAKLDHQDVEPLSSNLKFFCLNKLSHLQNKDQMPKSFFEYEPLTPPKLTSQPSSPSFSAGSKTQPSQISLKKPKFQAPLCNKKGLKEDAIFDSKLNTNNKKMQTFFIGKPAISPSGLLASSNFDGSISYQIQLEEYSTLKTKTDSFDWFSTCDTIQTTFQHFGDSKLNMNHNSSVNYLQFISDSKLLATSSSLQTVVIDVNRNEEPVCSFTGLKPSNYYSSISDYNNHNFSLLQGTKELGFVELFDFTTLKTIKTFQLQTQENIYAIQWLKPFTTLFYVARDDVAFYDTRIGNKVFTINNKGNFFIGGNVSYNSPMNFVMGNNSFVGKNKQGVISMYILGANRSSSTVVTKEFKEFEVHKHLPFAAAITDTFFTFNFDTGDLIQQQQNMGYAPNSISLHHSEALVAARYGNTIQNEKIIY